MSTTAMNALKSPDGKSGNRVTIRSPPPPPPATVSLEDRLSTLLQSPQFSVSAYLNQALEDDASDQRMTEVALQLQFQTAHCHEDISKIGAELQAVLPRCVADVGRVKVGLSGLEEDASQLLQQSVVQQAGVSSTTTSLETLSTLHALSAHLARTHEILTAAATWDKTLASTAPLLAQSSLAEAVHALAQLEQGERALRGMPNPATRTAAVQKVRASVMTLLQPQLQHALAALPGRQAPLQQCVTLYQQLQQMETLVAEYVKVRPAATVRAWFASQESFETTGLAGWLESVLQLVAEERRQATLIFGAARVPELIVRVLKECFVPILPSFKTRLENICSSNPEHQHQGKSGSLETVCSLYESTLRFCALAYETVATQWIDLVESGNASTTAPSGLVLYKSLTDLFVQIASPFSAYQKNLPELEAHHLERQTAVLAKDLREAVHAVTSTEGLPAALDPLRESVAALVPLAQGAVARLELLCGGHQVTRSLAAVDRILAAHTQEVAVGVQTLLATVQELAEWDESHVHHALSILKVAGYCRRALVGLETKTKERLGLAAQRMAAHAIRQVELQEALASNQKTALQPQKHKAWSLPESLSAIEIDVHLTKAVCGQNSPQLAQPNQPTVDQGEEAHDDDTAVLQRLATTVLKSSNSFLDLFPEADESMRRLCHACHIFVFDVCSTVPRNHLAGMSSLAVWKESPSAATDYASYGTLPQQYMTLVGEHMLALVQALEPFASHQESLVLANEVMDGVRQVAVQPWMDVCEAAGADESKSTVMALMDGKGLVDRVLGVLAVEDDEEDEDETMDEAAKASQAFCNAWLDVVGLAVTGRLLERMLRIPTLTSKGCEQLHADLNYLVNVLSALGLSGHPHPLLGHMAELLVADTSSLLERIAMRDRSDPLEEALRAMEEKLAAIRGASGNFRY